MKHTKNINSIDKDEKDHDVENGVPSSSSSNVGSTKSRYSISSSSSSSSSSIFYRLKTYLPSLFTSTSTSTSTLEEKDLDHALYYTSLFLFTNVMAWGVTMPFLQSRRDILGCDASCYGKMTSFRSLLEMMGGYLIGSLSDISSQSQSKSQSPSQSQSQSIWLSKVSKVIDWVGGGRKACLYLGCVANIVGIVISMAMFSIRGLYLSSIPHALFSSNFSVSKALLADHHEIVEHNINASNNRTMEHKHNNHNHNDGDEKHANENYAIEMNLLNHDQDLISRGKKDSNSNSKSKKSTTTTTTSNTNTNPPSSDKFVTARAHSMGQLGMAVGMAIMVGPFLGTISLNTFDQSAIAATFMNTLSIYLVYQIISTHTSSSLKGGYRRIRTSTSFDNIPSDCTNPKSSSTSSSSFILSWWPFSLLSSNTLFLTPGPLLLMTIRFFMVLSFYIFQTIWVPSLKQRFEFGPKQHGQFMSFVGLSYAFSQGVLAKKLMASPYFVQRPHYRSRILIVSCMFLGFGRYLTFQTNSMPCIYALFFIMVTSLGVMNTIINMDASALVSSSDVGSLFGLLESIESGAGILGPFIGAHLASWGKTMSTSTATTTTVPFLLSRIFSDVNTAPPLSAVISCYMVVACLTSYGYNRYVLPPPLKEVSK